MNIPVAVQFTGPRGPTGAATSFAVDRTELAAKPTQGAVFLTELGRGGVFQWNSSNLSAWVTLDPQQGVYIAPAPDPTGTSGAWVRVRDHKFVNTQWFGAKEWTTSGGDGFDSTSFIQAALDFSSNEGGRCFLQPGNYQIRDTLRNWGCEFLGKLGQQDNRPNTWDHLGYAYGSHLVWPELGVIDPAVSATKMMLLSESQDSTISGGIRTALIQPRNHDLVIDCNAQAGYGFYQGSAIRPKFENLHVERAVVAHVAVLPRNGNIAGLQWDNIVTDSRQRPPCAAADGMVIGPTDTGYCTGGKGGYGSFSGNTDGTGWGLRIGNIDTFHLDKAEFFGFKGGWSNQGAGIWFFTDLTKGNAPGRKCVVVNMGGGVVRTDPECTGIKIGSANSEGWQLDLHPNSQVSLGGIQDAVTGDNHKTLEYVLDDELYVPMKEAALTGAVASTLGTIGIPVISFADAATDQAVWLFPDRPQWNHGQICSVWVIYGASVADAGKNFRLELEVRCPRTDATTDIDTTIEFQWIEQFTIPAPTAANRLRSALCHFALPCDFKRRCAVAVRVQRLGTDAFDDSTQALKIAGVKLLFKGDGPNENQGEDPHSEHGRWESGQRLKQDDEKDVNLTEGNGVYNDYVGGYNPIPVITSYEAETNALIALFNSTPWQWQIYQINDTILRLKNTSSLWSKCDLIYIDATPSNDLTDQAHSEANGLINWKAPGLHTLVKSGTTNWVRNQGQRGNSSGFFTVDLNWSALGQFTQNNAHVGMVCSNEAASSTANASMFGSATTQNITLRPLDGTGNILTRLNTAAAGASTPNPRSRGHLMLNRTGAAGYDVWTRGTKLANIVAASAPVIAEPIVLLRGSAFNTNHRMAAFHCGVGLSDAECAQIAQIITYHCGHLRG